MEAEVKERLVGAVILVLLAVLVLPALLTGPKQAEPLQSPEAPVASRSVEIDLGGPQDDEQVEILPLDEAAPAPQPAAVREAPTGLPDTSEPPATSGAAPAADPAPAAMPVATPPAQPAQAPVGAGWAVQVAALSNRDAALKLVAELQRRGYPAFILEYRAAGRVLYRVRIGPEADRGRAVAMAARLKSDGTAGNVVSHP